VRRLSHRLTAIGVVMAALAAALLPMTSATAAPAGNGKPGARPICGTASGPVHYDHVIWIWMENTPYVDVAGSAQAPFANALASQCGLTTNYHNLTHPSAPNYLGATSGYLGGTNDCTPYQCPDTNNNLFRQISSTRGQTWKTYAESMQTNCYDPASAANPGLNTVGLYDSLHNPPIYYTDLKAECARNDIPMGTVSQGSFAHDLATRLPTFSFISPNKCNDDHDCAVSVGDAYLRSLIGAIVTSRQYREGHTAIFLTWDEGERGVSNDCAYNTTDIGCHVATVVVSPSTRPGTVSAELFNHYSLLKTTEQLLHLPILGHANDPAVKSMLHAFRL
jgi:phospholipase C